MFKKLWKAICEVVEAYGEAMRIVEIERYKRMIEVYEKKLEKFDEEQLTNISYLYIMVLYQIGST